MKNKKIIFSFLVILILISLAAMVLYFKRETIFIDNGTEKIKLRVEVADTTEKRERGLMFRNSLDDNGGMLFAFNNEAYYNLWMKNMLIPLDIILISKDFNIVEIIYAQPCKENPCETYKPKRPAKYILSVNSNFTIKNNINEGNKVIVKEKVVEKMMRNLG